jgi:HlyD family secretion protein
MVTQNKNLFRKEAVDHLASPERLDQLMQVVHPKKWIPLAAMGSMIAAGLVWSVVGRIPITVNGQGVIVFPSKVVALQAPSAGVVQSLNVRVGDMVKKGQVLGIIDQTELQKNLQLARLKLEQLLEQDRKADEMRSQRSLVDQDATDQQRRALRQSLEATQSVTPILQEKGLESIRRDRQNLRNRLAVMRDLLPTLKQRLENRQKLVQEGAVSADTALQAQQDYLDGQAKIDAAESELRKLDVQEADAQRQYLANLNSIQDLYAQTKTLNSRILTQVEQDFTTATNRKKEIQETERAIAQLELQLKGKSQILSKYNGRVLELAIVPGQSLEQGARLGTIEAQDSANQLTSVVFFPVSEGKKIRKGMTLQITPSTVKRERFGGIVGTVTNISAFPVTKEGAASVVGGAELLQSLKSQEPQLQVFAELQTDPTTPSGFRWSSSQGPQMPVTSGTTASIRATVEEQAPITFVFPILRSWSGMY